jgi:hypothetical protein
VIARRLPFVVVGAALVTLLFADRAAPEPLPPSTYGEDPLAQSTPAVFDGDLLSTSWFCPGGPTADGRSTSLTIFNSTNDPREVTVSAVNDAGNRSSTPLTLPPRNRAVVNLGDLAPGAQTSATVAVWRRVASNDGRRRTGVDQPVRRPGLQHVYCGRTTTADASLTLVLYNPFPDDAVVDVSLTTVERTLQPPSLQAAVIPGQSVRIVDLGQQAQREEVVSTSVKGRGSRLVVGRIQSADNPARHGFTAGLAASQAQQTWWLPDGDKGDGISERLVVFNPGELEASVELSFLPAAGAGSASPTSSCHRRASGRRRQRAGRGAGRSAQRARQRRGRSDAGGGRARGPDPSTTPRPRPCSSARRSPCRAGT